MTFFLFSTTLLLGNPLSLGLFFGSLFIEGFLCKTLLLLECLHLLDLLLGKLRFLRSHGVFVKMAVTETAVFKFK